jgi:hypothetical protein
MAAVLPQAVACAAMRHILLLAVFTSTLASPFAFAQPPERPNTPVFRSGPWFVVRAAPPNEAVACTGFYSANRRVQLSKDMLVIQTPDDVKSVAFGVDDQPMGSQRALSADEKDLKGIAFTGEDFAKLAKGRKLRIDVATAQGTMRHEFELNGLAGALENINAGCPVPKPAPAQKPVRRKHRS